MRPAELRFATRVRTSGLDLSDAGMTPPMSAPLSLAGLGDSQYIRDLSHGVVKGDIRIMELGHPQPIHLRTRSARFPRPPDC